jgi:hypothetical protein
MCKKVQSTTIGLLYCVEQAQVTILQTRLSNDTGLSCVEC